MALDEIDLDRLEGYLDDALADGEREAVRARLAAEPQWKLALDHLRGERAMRQVLFSSLEPSGEEVERLVAGVHAAIERRRRFAGVMRAARYVGAAAACFVVGFLVHATFFAAQPGEERPMAQPISDPGASVRAVEMYEVTLWDESGKVVAVQRFDGLEKAQEFANDVSRWQRRAERLAGGQFVVRAQRL